MNKYLVKNIFDTKSLAMAPTRDGYGKGLLEAGEKDQRVVVLCADLAESTRSHWFKEKFPERFIEVGVAEQNMATIAAGIANYGKIPFISSYAAFSPGRNNEQIRTTISLNNLPVKIAGAHAGVSVGPDGATHQALEDMALMRVQPNMVVISPCDAIEAQKATFAAAFNNKPTYIRFGREKSPVFTTEKMPFEIGKAVVLREGKDVTIIACGPLVYEALLSAEKLEREGIDAEVINNHTIKPMDTKTILASVKKTGAVVTVEEHQIMGGMGSTVAEVLAMNFPAPVEMIGMQDCFGQSGTPDELLNFFGMTHPYIVKAVKKVTLRRGSGQVKRKI